MILIVKTIGWDFYNAANAAYWNPIYAVQEPAAPVSHLAVPGHVRRLAGRQPPLPGRAYRRSWGSGSSAGPAPSSSRRRASSSRPPSTACCPPGRPTSRPSGASRTDRSLLMIVPSIVVSAIYAYRAELRERASWTRRRFIALTFLATRRRRDHPALAAQGHLRRLADRAARRSPAFRRSASSAWSAAIFLLFMLWEWSFNAADLYGTTFSTPCTPSIYFVATLRRGRRHLRGRANHPQEPGHRPFPHPPRDSG